MKQMLFPNGYVTNYGDASYTTMNTEQLELMMAYSHDKKTLYRKESLQN